MASGAAPRDIPVPDAIRRFLDDAGIVVNGPNPRDMQVHDPAVFRRLMTTGTLGLGEAYMDGLWDCDRLDQFFHRCLMQQTADRVRTGASLLVRLQSFRITLSNRLRNLQKRSRAFQVGEQHYDTGFELFSRMLDSTLSYSCGFWRDAQTLEEAQLAKLDRVCRKLQLQPGEKLLDIGCGWGGMARHAALNYGVEVTGVTVSRDQAEVARERCKGLPVEIILEDYRELRGQFDKIVSIGMFEHVGARNYRTYFATANRVLKPGGLFLLHTIGDNRTNDRLDPWINRYIFPNGQLPSAQRIAAALEPDLLIRDWENFGCDYDTTLMAWWKNFETHWNEIAHLYDERFHRMWRYYLCSCAGMFRADMAQLWQLVISRTGERNDYRSLR